MALPPIKMVISKSAPLEDKQEITQKEFVMEVNIKVEEPEQEDLVEKNTMMMKLELQEGKDDPAPSVLVEKASANPVPEAIEADMLLGGKESNKKVTSTTDGKRKRKDRKPSKKSSQSNQISFESTKKNSREDVWFEELDFLREKGVAKSTFKSTRRAFPVIHWKKEKNGGKKEGPIQKLIQNSAKPKEVEQNGGEEQPVKAVPAKRKRKRERKKEGDKTAKKPKVDHKCLVCQKEFQKMEQLNVHMRIHSGLKPYVCSVCQKGFMRNRELIKHTRLHTGEKLSKCTVCPKVFTSKSALDRHFRGHTGEKPFTCYICGKSYKENSGLQGHMRVHTGEKPFMCSLCGKSFHQRAHLYIHMKFHSSEKPHSCSVCGKAYRMKSEVKVHMRVHTGERPHKCEECGKSFRDTGTLRKHQKIHTGEKPWKCTTCGDAFRESGALYKHMRGHTGEKPYECAECGRAFREKEVLTRHMRIHSGEKPCKCTVCFKAFRESGALYRHMRTHANKGEKPANNTPKQKSNSQDDNAQSSNGGGGVNNSGLKVPNATAAETIPQPMPTTPPLLPVNSVGFITNSYSSAPSFLPAVAFPGNASVTDFLTNITASSIPPLTIANSMQSGYLN